MPKRQTGQTLVQQFIHLQPQRHGSRIYQINMASSTLQKLLRNRSESASKLFSNFRQPHPAIPHCALTHIPQLTNSDDALRFRIRPEKDFLKSDHSCGEYIYSGFSFGFFLNPSCPGPIIQSYPDAEITRDDSHIIRADSVKKKRKKKMNKHKLSKLRKRLRKKT